MRSHMAGTMSDTSTLRLSLSRFDAGVKNCWMPHIGKAGTMPKNMRHSIKTGLAKTLVSPSTPWDSMS